MGEMSELDNNNNNDKYLREQSLVEERELGLQYFKRLQDSELPGTPDHAADKWDKRAEVWEQEYSDKRKMKSDDRIKDTADYLRGRGLLGPDCDVVDIGCGPGRFAAAFARTARHVVGLDISERMIHYGNAHAEREGLQNVSLRVCDFQTLDIEREGLAGKFDLVFSSITPAIHGMSGLEKAMRMSRKYCCDISFVHSANEMETAIMREVFGRERPSPWNTHWFYTTFNVLLLMGYYPEATYFKRHQENDLDSYAERAKLFLEQMLAPHEQTPENEARVLSWMRKRADANGTLTEVSDIWYGRLLWDVRDVTERQM